MMTISTTQSRSNPYCIGNLIEEKLIFADAEKEALVLILIVLET